MHLHYALMMSVWPRGYALFFILSPLPEVECEPISGYLEGRSDCVYADIFLLYYIQRSSCSFCKFRTPHFLRQQNI